MSTAAPWRIRIDRPPPAGVAVPDGIELTDDLIEADGVIVGASEPWDASVCDRLPRLKVVVRAGIGYDNVDPASCASVGVAACHTPDAPTVSTAEHALALLLAVSKRIKPSEHRLRAGLGNYQAAHGALELEGRTLGLLGGGRIGGRVARYGAALGMRVQVCDPYLDPSVLAGVAESVDLDELWRGSDAVSLHAPATAATRHIVNAASISAMRPGVIVVKLRPRLVDRSRRVARRAGIGPDRGGRPRRHRARAAARRSPASRARQRDSHPAYRLVHHRRSGAADQSSPGPGGGVAARRHA